MARLGDICIINPKSPSFDDNLTVSFVPMPKVGENGEFDPSETRKYHEVKKGFTYFQNDDVLFAKITPCMENGKGAIASDLKNGIGFGSTEFHVLRPVLERVTSKWLFYLLSWSLFRKDAEKNMTGSAGQKRVPKSFLEEYSINVPELKVQKEMTDTLEQTCYLISLRKQQLTKLDELVKSRFVELFGDPISNPNGWKTEKAETHIDLLSGFPFDSSQYTESGVNICGGLIIMPQRIEWNDCKHWCSIEGYEEYTLKKNDIVIALDRPWISEGFKIAMVDAEHLPALLIQRTARIRAIGINQFYLMYCFLLGGFDKHCNVTGSLVPHISAKDIRSFSIMLPPLELQEQFAAFVEQTDKSKLTIQESLDKLELLKKALTQKYFG